MAIKKHLHIFSSLILVFFFTACTSLPAQSVLQAVESTQTDASVTPTGDPTNEIKNPDLAGGELKISEFNVILGRPTDHSITLSLYSIADRMLMVDLGTSSGLYETQSGMMSMKAGVPQNLELDGLIPDATYYYRITADGIPQLEHSFHTQRPAGSAFTFTVDADPHNREPNFNGDLYNTTLSNALNDHPDFHIDLGDTFMTEKINPQNYEEALSTFTDMRPYLGLIGSAAPLYLVNGNHEGEIGWPFKNQQADLKIWSTELRHLYYPNPIPNAFYTGAVSIDPALNQPRDGYYSWTWGDALFVVLDPFWYTSSKPQPDDLESSWNWTLGREQYDWLKTTLQSSSSKYKFVSIHNLVGGSTKDARGGIEAAPYFEWGGNNSDGSYGFDQQHPGWGIPIHQLLVENQVSAVFHGHDHVFVKQDLDGIVYQEVPQPDVRGCTTRMAEEYGYKEGVIYCGSGYLRITVSPETAQVSYIRTFLPEDESADLQNGMLQFEYSIDPK